MSIAINLAGTPCCGVIYRYDVEDRELMLLDLGYCPDCGRYMGDMDSSISFHPAAIEDGQITRRARWDYNAAVNIFTGHTPTGCDGEELDLELV
jgi:hypothetical protein